MHYYCQRQTFCPWTGFHDEAGGSLSTGICTRAPGARTGAGTGASRSSTRQRNWSRARQRARFGTRRRSRFSATLGETLGAELGAPLGDEVGLLLGRYYSWTALFKIVQVWCQSGHARGEYLRTGRVSRSRLVQFLQ
jgi:hypothetical protein